MLIVLILRPQKILDKLPRIDPECREAAWDANGNEWRKAPHQRSRRTKKGASRRPRSFNSFPLYCKQDIFIFYIQWLIFLLIGNTMKNTMLRKGLTIF
ncbi:TPA: hypothetical protein QEN11_23640 [Stenotrophomonas maltophilia]|nr:hypothetical protein [Stenotrophomonas maltophilia]HEP1209833.1 hypothetical protein [Stenotrophomonas maltophilia]